MSKTHCSVRHFNRAGDFVFENTTHDEGCVPGVARTLAVPEIVAVEIHFEDGSSKEYKFLEE